MTGKALKRTLSRLQYVVCGALVTGLLLGTTLAYADQPENTLIVWAGDKAHEAPDFIAVIDFDSDSPNYGKSSVSYRYRQGYLELAPSATSHTMSASPATGGRWPSVACSAFCEVRLRPSSLM